MSSERNCAVVVLDIQFEFQNKHRSRFVCRTCNLLHVEHIELKFNMYAFGCSAQAGFLMFRVSCPRSGTYIYIYIYIICLIN